jgi:exonuclease III
MFLWLLVYIIRNTNYSYRGSAKYRSKEEKLNNFKEKFQNKANKEKGIIFVGMIINLCLAEIDFLMHDNEWKTFDMTNQNSRSNFEKAVKEKCNGSHPDICDVRASTSSDHNNKSDALGNAGE